MSIFNIDSPLMQKLSLLWDLIVLNVLTLIFSTPIITAGAAITALYDAAWRLRTHQGTLLKNYWKAFTSNFKKATLLFIPVLVFGLILGYNAVFMRPNITADQQESLIPLIVGFVIWAMITTWVFPLQSRFENSWGRTLINALICALRFPGKTIPMMVLNMAPWAVLILLPEQFVQIGPLWFMAWFALAAYWNVMLMEGPMRFLVGLSEAAEAAAEEKQEALPAEESAAPAEIPAPEEAPEETPETVEQ